MEPVVVAKTTRKKKAAVQKVVTPETSDNPSLAEEVVPTETVAETVKEETEKAAIVKDAEWLAQGLTTTELQREYASLGGSLTFDDFPDSRGYLLRRHRALVELQAADDVQVHFVNPTQAAVHDATARGVRLS